MMELESSTSQLQLDQITQLVYVDHDTEGTLLQNCEIIFRYSVMLYSSLPKLNHYFRLASDEANRLSKEGSAATSPGRRTGTQSSLHSTQKEKGPSSLYIFSEENVIRR